MTNAYGMQFGPQDALHSPTYSTIQNRLQVDLDNPLDKLFDVVTFPAGTAFSVNEAAVQTDTEQLYVVNHGLGYKPQVYVVFSLILIGSNSLLTFALDEALLGVSNAITDSINYQINGSTLNINHTVSSNGSGSGSYTSAANTYEVQMKYIICNNPHIRTPTLF